jgi:hypothetical protein
VRTLVRSGSQAKRSTVASPRQDSAVGLKNRDSITD